MESQPEKLYKGHKNVTGAKKTKNLLLEISRKCVPGLSGTFDIFLFSCVKKIHHFNHCNLKLWQQKGQINSGESAQNLILKFLVPPVEGHIVTSVVGSRLHRFKLNTLRLQNITFSNKCGCG